MCFVLHIFNYTDVVKEASMTKFLLVCLLSRQYLGKTGTIKGSVRNVVLVQFSDGRT